MANYTSLFGSSFPNSIMESTTYTDLSSSMFDVAQQYVSLCAAGDATQAAALLAANPALKNSMIGSKIFNRLSEEIRNVEIYIADILPNTKIIVDQAEEPTPVNGMTWIEITG